MLKVVFLPITIMILTRIFTLLACLFIAPASVFAQAFIPSDYGTVALHLKADALALSNGASVSNWGGLTVAPGVTNGANAPTFVLSDAGFNNKPVVQFTAANRNVLAGTGVNYTAQTVFAVVSLDSTAVSLAGLVGRGDDKLNIRRNNATNFYRSPGQGQDANDFSGVAVTGSLSVNNVASAAYTNSAAHLVIATAGAPQLYTNFWLGNPSATLARFWQGKIAEVLVYQGTLNPTQTNAVGHYLQTKYNLPTNFTAPFPVVTSFTGATGGIVSPIGILSPGAGSPVTLNWSTQSAASVSIDNGVLSAPGSASGSATVSPSTTTTYTLSATNGAGMVNSTFTVHVGATPAHPTINEFVAENTDGLTDPTDPLSHPDWLEIYNPNAYGMPLSGYRLKNNLAEWNFPPGAGIPANGYLVVLASGKNLTNPATTMHTNFTLDAEGEHLALLRISDLAVATEFSPAYPNQLKDISYGWWQPRNGYRYFGKPTGAPTPGAANGALGVLGFLQKTDDTVFSVKRGFYATAQTTDVTCTTPGATLVYTTNGSTPSLTNGTQVAPVNAATPPAVSLTIHPGAVPGGASGVNVASVGGVTMLRVALFKDDFAPTEADTQTYVFSQQLLTQTEADATTRGWPASTTNVNGQVFNYGIDPNAIAAYPAAQIEQSLHSLPMVSIVTDIGNWVDPLTGVYVNADLRGEAWERPTSVEVIHPPGYVSPDGNATGFQIDAGIRIRGGASRGDSFFKHALRLYFDNDYDGKLNYPLFGDEGTNKFSVVDLATASNYGWYRETSYLTGRQNTMIRDMFCRDTQGAMGQPYAKSRFYHVMLNGVYWGIYYTDERAVADFGASYHGGDEDDYDAVKCGNRGTIPNFATEATDGDLVAWTNLWNKTRAIGTQNASDEKFFELLGRNPDGTRNFALPVLLDVDNLIDEMLVIFYSGDGDAVLSNFLSRNTPNNWFSYYKRNGESGFKFIIHDAEHSLGSSSSVPDQTGPFGGSNVSSLQFSNPQRIHQDLMASAAYRRRFADRVQKHFFNDGALTTARNIARFNARAAQIRNAMKMEEARWGDARLATDIPIGHAPRYTVADWEAAVASVTSWMSTRNAVVLDQLSRDGLFTSLTPPVMANDATGTPQRGGNIAPGFALRLTAGGSPSPVIYYTTDGSDPRPELAPAPSLTTFLPESASGEWHVPTSAADGYTALTNSAVARAFYPLDAGSAADTATADGAQNGTFVGSPTQTTNRNGTANSAMSFSGSGQSITLGDPSALQITGQITLAAWVRTTAAPTNAVRNIVAKGPGTSGAIFLRMNGGDWEVGSSNGTNHMASFPVYTDLSSWVHLAGTYDGVAWRLYRNGQLVATQVDPVGAVSVTGGSPGWTIGGNGAGTGALWTGQLDDVAIFNTALTPTQVAGLAGLNNADWAQPGATLAGTWTTSPGGIGYERDLTNTLDPAITTDIEASLYNIRSSVQLRKNLILNASQIATIKNLILRIRYDDGYVAYLNGVEVSRKNAPAMGVLNGLSASSATHNDADALAWENVDITPFAGLLVDGNNVVAIQGLNTSAADEDFLLNVELAASTVPYGIGGNVQIYTAPIVLNTQTTVKTRTFLNGEWSALDSALFTVNTTAASPLNLVVSQVAYNPIGGSGFEWIELMAVGAQNVDLTNVSIGNAVDYTFPAGTVLSAGGRVQVAGNIANFVSRYGAMPPVNLMPSVFVGNLSNDSETIRITRFNGTGNEVIKEFTYNADATWPNSADGLGAALVLIDPASNPDHTLGINWRASATSGGSPGVNDATDYAAWAAANGVTDPLGEGDEDYDGLANLLEYFFGSNPAQFTTQLATAIQTVTVNGVPSDYLTITFTRKLSNDEATFSVESSTDFAQPWEPAIRVGAPIFNGDGSETYTFRHPISRADAAKQFLRVRVAR
jgi:hypothetical protein